VATIFSDFTPQKNTARRAKSPSVSLAGELLESTIQCPGNFLFCSHRRVRRRGDNCFFLLFQKGGPLSAVPVILAVGAAIMAIAGILFFREPASWPRVTWHYARDRGAILAAQITLRANFWMVELLSSLCKKLQSDVSHRACVADNVASTGEEQVKMFVQLPGAAEVERHVGTPAALFRRVSE
jgi:hypothetical protein